MSDKLLTLIKEKNNILIMLLRVNKHYQYIGI